jgi:hypothetical protein
VTRVSSLPEVTVLLGLLAQSSVPSNAARRGSELSQWASEHRVLLVVLGVIALIGIFVFVARMRRDS